MTLLNLVKQSTILHIYFFVVFIVSGLIVNILQVFTLLLWPISKSLYRLANAYLAYLHWAQLVFLYDTYSGSHIIVHCDDQFYKAMTQDRGLLLMNHTFDLDWLATWCLADRYSQLQSAKCFMKNDLKYVPLVGWGFYLLEMPFLKRDIMKDREQLVEGMKLLAEFPMAAKLLLFCEGTRFTPEKYEKSKKFAIEKGLPVLKHHLTPRTKGFCMAIEGLKGRVPIIVDATVAAESSGGTISLFDLLIGKKTTFHALLKVRDMNAVPSGSYEETAEYCRHLYQEKDEAMDYFYKNDTFYGFDDTVKQRFLPARIQPTLVVIMWNLVLGMPILYHLCRVLLSGSVLTICGFILVAFLFQIALHRMMKVSVSSHGSSYGSEKPSSPIKGNAPMSFQTNGDSCHANGQSATDTGAKKDE